MSRRTFHFHPDIGGRITVCAGWDRPLNHLHLTVFREDDQGEEDELLWDCLRLDEMYLHGLTVEAVYLIVRGFTSNIPLAWMEDIKADVMNKTGNAQKTYS